MSRFQLNWLHNKRTMDPTGPAALYSTRIEWSAESTPPLRKNKNQWMTANLFQTDAVPVLRTRSTFTKKIKPIRNHFGTRGLNADTNTSAPECNPCWIMTSKLVHGSDMNHPRSNIRAEEPEGPDFSYQNEPLDGDALLPLLFRDTFLLLCLFWWCLVSWSVNWLLEGSNQVVSLDSTRTRSCRKSWARSTARITRRSRWPSPVDWIWSI